VRVRGISGGDEGGYYEEVRRIADGWERGIDF